VDVGVRPEKPLSNVKGRAVSGSQEQELEECCRCGEPTGNAGRGDGSIYCDECDTGPFCAECVYGEDHSRCPNCGAQVE